MKINVRQLKPIKRGARVPPTAGKIAHSRGLRVTDIIKEA